MLTNIRWEADTIVSGLQQFIRSHPWFGEGGGYVLAYTIKLRCLHYQLDSSIVLYLLNLACLQAFNE